MLSKYKVRQLPLFKSLTRGNTVSHPDLCIFHLKCTLNAFNFPNVFFCAVKNRTILLYNPSLRVKFGNFTGQIL